MPPLVSVIMPAYNAERFVAEAIESVRAQTLPAWELVVADDGSTDRTREVVASFDDPRVRLLSLPHQGSPSRARNAALAVATAPLVAFLDADDRFFPDALEVLSERLLSTPSLQASFGFQHLMDERGTALRPSPFLVPNPDGTYRLAPSFQLSWPAVYLFHLSLAVSSLMVRRETLHRLGGFDERVLSNEDVKLYIQIFQLGFDRVAVLPRCVYWYRRSPDTLTKNKARVLEVLDAENEVVEWLYAQPTTTPELARLKPAAHALKYITYARTRYRAGDAQMARALLRRARAKGHVTKRTWWRHMGGLWLRTWLPVSLDAALANLYRPLRRDMYRSRAVDRSSPPRGGVG